MRSSRHLLFATVLSVCACSTPASSKTATATDATSTATDMGNMADEVPSPPDGQATVDVDSVSDLQYIELPDTSDIVSDVPPTDIKALDELSPKDEVDLADLATADVDVGYTKPGPDAQQTEADVVIKPPDPPYLEGCKDVRQKHDNKVFWDNCWDPPHHYCSDGADAAMIWVGCKPGTLVCCEFGSSCIPCGWVHCSPTSGATPDQLQKCTDVAVKWDTLTDPPEECQPYISNYNPICWDDVDPSWNDVSHHKGTDAASWLNW